MISGLAYILRFKVRATRQTVPSLILFTAEKRDFFYFYPALLIPILEGFSNFQIIQDC